jgi:hypothetical protein
VSIRTEERMGEVICHAAEFQLQLLVREQELRAHFRGYER